MVMKRTSFKSAGFTRARPAGAASLYQAGREQRLAARAARACSDVVPRASSMGPADIVPALKDPEPARSEPYRRVVAARPCIHCGIQGYSQHAHENEGKAKGTKVDDRRAMPLCCAWPGNEGCHVAFDQYRLLPGGRDAHHAAGRAWAAQTRAAILESGQWPPRLPAWDPEPK